MSPAEWKVVWEGRYGRLPDPPPGEKFEPSALYTPGWFFGEEGEM